MRAASGADADRDRIIDRAIAAHGGERLAALTSIVTEWLLDDALIYQSRRPEPPWDTTRRWEAYAVDFDAGAYADARHDGGSGYQWMTGTVLDDARALRLDYRNRTYRAIPANFDGAIADAMVLSPLVLLRWLAERRELAVYSGQARDDDASVDVLRLSRADDAELEVRFDAASGRVHGLRSGYTDFDGTEVPLDIRYAEWRESAGLRYPAHVEIRAHGFVARRASLAHQGVDRAMDGYLQVPDEFVATASEAPDVRAFRIEQIADGVYFVGEGVMYQLFVEFEDFLVAMDGSSGDVQRRIDAIRERIPAKPFRFVLASHHHDDHLHGLDEFVALGATVVAAPAHVGIVEEYVAGKLGRAPEVVSVEDEFGVADGKRELRILQIGPTPHSEQMLAAYLPDEKILFAADLYVLGARRQPVMPAMANGLALFDKIAMRGLDAGPIVDPHSPLIATWSDLQRSVDALRGTTEGIMTRARADLAIWASARRHVPAEHRAPGAPR